MFNRKKNNLLRKFFLNQYLLVVLVLLILFLISVPLAKNMSKKYDIDSEVQSLEDEIIGLQKKNIELEKMINDYSSSDFVEEIARLNLGLKKEGEEVLVVKRESPVKKEPFLSPNKIKFAGDTIESKPHKWLRYFLKK